MSLRAGSLLKELRPHICCSTGHNGCLHCMAQLQRSIAARGGSMPSPSNSWGKSITQVVPYSCAHHPLFQQLRAAQLSLTILVVFLPGKMLYSVD